MKFSIRVSLLTILLSLLLGVSLFIIGINYYNLNKILIEAAKQNVAITGQKVTEQITRYLQPLDRRAFMAASLIENDSIIPTYSSDFLIFLHTIFADDQGISAAYWADTKGNFFLVKDLPNNKIKSEIILRDDNFDKTIENIYDQKMNLISRKETAGSKVDPRVRPWYQQTKYEKQHTWYIYPLVDIEKNTTELGISSSFPIYDANNVLRGVFSLDLPLKTISSFVKNLQVTPHSLVMICDDKGHLISGYTAKTSIEAGYIMPKISDLEIPWVEKAYDLYRSTKKSVFLFTFADEQYIAAFDDIPNIKGHFKWSTAVITPVQDVIAPLQKNTLYSLLSVLIALLGGIYLSSYFASRLSEPIKMLANDADLICQLRLEEIKKHVSRITEIEQITLSFDKMKNALQSFKRYIPTHLVKKLTSTGKMAKVGGELRRLTIVFTDIRDFTALSEAMQPKDTMLFLSEYFQVITKIIHSHHGSVDKYLGDGSLAFWGAPLDDSNHELHACQAIIEISSALKMLNEKWHSENKPEVFTRIGVNSGPVIIGNVGSDDKLNYTAIGDSVNLASRLESLNKDYNTNIMLSEFTYQKVKNHFKFRLLDKVAVRGKKQGVYIYELLGNLTTEPDTKLEKYNFEFTQAFDFYEKGEWEKAYEQFSLMATHYPEDNLINIFIERCTTFKVKPPANWTGVWSKM